ncbi:Radical SAM superfamily enzyme, MoaA/NifB/PqqE/SkfB family [Actinosynnema pretiosum]|nr:Radical SAM superfamily enzyme, MoaA/NifB/PqqE/SkfB family [Actinosynnema pretiosum]
MGMAVNHSPTTTLTTVHDDTPRFVAVGRRGGTALLHDPLTGQTHTCPDDLPPGRLALPSAEITAFPLVHPGDLGDRLPVSLCWSPLVRCNLACPHCLDDKSLTELAFDGRASVAAVLAESGVLAVDVSGGEPLLLRDLGDLLDTLRAGGCAVSVTTNGTRLPRQAEALADRLDAVRVSFDGHDAPSHDHWRGAGSFDRAVQGVRAAVAHGIPVQLQTVLMKCTAGRLRQVVDLADRLGAHGVTFLQFLPIGEGAALVREQIGDERARELVAALPQGPVAVRLRTRDDASGFTVVRADGRVWRNAPGSTSIGAQRELRTTEDLLLDSREGTA